MMYIQWLVHGIPDAMRPTEEAVSKSTQVVLDFQATNDFAGAIKYVETFGETFENRIKFFCGEDWYRLRRTLEVALTVQAEPDMTKPVAIRKTSSNQNTLPLPVPVSLVLV